MHMYLKRERERERVCVHRYINIYRYICMCISVNIHISIVPCCFPQQLSLPHDCSKGFPQPLELMQHRFPQQMCICLPRLLLAFLSLCVRHPWPPRPSLLGLPMRIACNPEPAPTAPPTRLSYLCYLFYDCDGDDGRKGEGEGGE